MDRSRRIAPREAGPDVPDDVKLARERDWGSVTSGSNRVGYFSAEEDATIRERVIQWGRMNDQDLVNLTWAVSMMSTGKVVTGRGHRGEGLWTFVAEGVEGRNAKQCWGRGRRILNPDNRKGAWSPEEDRALMTLFRSVGAAAKGRFKKCSEALSRSADACASRVRILLENEESGKSKRVPFTGEEDTKLRAAVEAWQKKGAGEGAVAAAHSQHPQLRLDGVNWGEVAKSVPMRTPKQCMNRYNVHLRPTMREKGEWARGEDSKLLEALYESSARNEAEVKWGQLVEGRDADIAQRRWVMMQKMVPKGRSLGFRQCVENLRERRAQTPASTPRK